MEKRDITRFLFGIRNPQTHQLFLVQTFEMTISGAAQSNLVQFIRGWTAREPYGFDYLSLKGSGATLTIGHKQSTKTPGLFYAIILNASPVYPALANEIPQPALFAELVTKANTPRPMPSTTGAVGPGIVPSAVLGMPGVGAMPPRKFWTPGLNGQAVLVTEQQIIAKGEPMRQIMAENQVGRWVPASSLIKFPVTTPPATLPPMPIMPPPPPAPGPDGAVAAPLPNENRSTPGAPPME
jgi:hypothetical protein